MNNYYKILEVKDFSPLHEIKLAYKKLAKKLHPDVNDGDKFFEEKFKELQIAYDVLSDPIQRDRFDENLKTSLRNSHARYNDSSNQKTNNTNSKPQVRKENQYILVKGRFVKRRRW